MYSRLHSLTTEAVEALLELKENVAFTTASGSRRRQGLNDMNALSIYNYSKWFNWKSAQRDIVKGLIPEAQTKYAKQVWFLEIPEKTGFLDVMTYWVGTEAMCGKVCAYALKDQVISISGREVRVKKGEGIYFCLSEVHQIKPSAAGQLWFCTMVQKPVSAVL